MDKTTVERNPEEVAEIERHKYFLSEKAGCDVGWDFAEQDWEEKFGEQFRQDQRVDVGSSEGHRPSGSGISMLFKRLFSG